MSLSGEIGLTGPILSVTLSDRIFLNLLLHKPHKQKSPGRNYQRILKLIPFNSSNTVAEPRKLSTGFRQKPQKWGNFLLAN